MEAKVGAFDAEIKYVPDLEFCQTYHLCQLYCLVQPERLTN